MRRITPRIPDEEIAGMIGGPQWNMQTVLIEQRRQIDRNDRRITLGYVAIMIEVVIAVMIVLITYLIVRN